MLIRIDPKKTNTDSSGVQSCCSATTSCLGLGKVLSSMHALQLHCVWAHVLYYKEKHDMGIYDN